MVPEFRPEAPAPTAVASINVTVGSRLGQQCGGRAPDDSAPDDDDALGHLPMLPPGRYGVAIRRCALQFRTHDQDGILCPISHTGA